MLPLTSYAQITVHSHTPFVANSAFSSVGGKEGSQKDVCAFDMPVPLALKVNSSMLSWQADIPQALQTSPTRLWKLPSPPHLKPRSKSRHFSLRLALSLMVLLCVEEENGKTRFWLPSPCMFEDLCMCVCSQAQNFRMLFCWRQKVGWILSSRKKWLWTSTTTAFLGNFVCWHEVHLILPCF